MPSVIKKKKLLTKKQAEDIMLEVLEKGEENVNAKKLNLVLKEYPNTYLAFISKRDRNK